MTQNEKELLLKDLSTRVPYGVKAHVRNWSGLDMGWIENEYVVRYVSPYLNNVYVSSESGSVHVILGHDDYDIKPYLFPMSSMTEEQKKEFIKYSDYTSREEDCGRHTELYYYNMVGHEDELYPNYDSIDWLNAHHFDYRGLIEKDLAIDATNLKIYQL